MAKKFSLLGCVALLIASLHQQQTTAPSFSGMLLEARGVSERLSLALLFGRLLIAVLFLYVGLSELHRLLFQPFTPYLPGDGHDVVWPKAVELLLALPFILGVKVCVHACSPIPAPSHHPAHANPPHRTTASHLARMQTEEVARLLIRAGADPTEENLRGVAAKDMSGRCEPHIVDSLVRPPATLASSRYAPLRKA